MTVSQKLTDFATAVGYEVGAMKDKVNGKAPDLTALATANKTNLVGAINEIHSALVAPTIAALLARSTPQPLVSGSETVLTFETLVHGIGLTGVPISIITIPTGASGYYTLSGNVALEGGNGTRRSISIYVNGVLVARHDEFPAAASQFINISATTYLVATDTVEIKVFHDHGSTINALESGTCFNLVRVAA